MLVVWLEKMAYSPDWVPTISISTGSVKFFPCLGLMVLSNDKTIHSSLPGLLDFDIAAIWN